MPAIPEFSGRTVVTLGPTTLHRGALAMCVHMFSAGLSVPRATFL
jgi:hypothetical protein